MALLHTSGDLGVLELLRGNAIASPFVAGTDPMVVIRWKDIFESLEAGVDSCACSRASG